MNTFKVGDLVEIVGSPNTRPAMRHVIGRTGIVVCTGIAIESGHIFPGEQFCLLSPADISGPNGWYSRALRKINPPDWEAPRVRETELTE